MEYKKLGNTDLKVSSLGFGAMRLSIPPGSNEFTKAIELLKHANNGGINFFDVGTFYCHHQCEAAFGQAIKGLEHKIIISGKNSSHQSIHENWTDQLKNTLSQFGRDALDIYFIHYLNKLDWDRHFIQEGVIDQVEQAKNEGFIKYLGFSSHDTPEHIRYLIDTGSFDAIILSYNFLNRTYEDTMKYAFEKGLGVIIMNPLAGGILKDSYLDLHELKDHFNAGIPEIAMNYVLSNPNVHSVLSGMQSVDEIDNNITTACDERNTPEDLEIINDVITRSRKEHLTYCTGCGYCLPCTQGIDIPEVINIWNQINLVKGKNLFNREYQLLDVTADCCIKCRICEEKCPNNIAVSVIMEKVSGLLA
jgi:predicted aldo/keto reductase-like oxidoreductase